MNKETTIKRLKQENEELKSTIIAMSKIYVSYEALNNVLKDISDNLNLLAKGGRK